MSGGDDDLAARLAGFRGKRPRLDAPALNHAIAAGRRTLLDPGVEAAHIMGPPPSASSAAAAADDCAAAPPVPARPVEPDRAAPAARGRRAPRQSAAAPVRASVPIPRDLHLALRLHCLRHRRQVQDVILELIEAERRRGGFDA